MYLFFLNMLVVMVFSVCSTGCAKRETLAPVENISIKFVSSVKKSQNQSDNKSKIQQKNQKKNQQKTQTKIAASTSGKTTLFPWPTQGKLIRNFSKSHEGIKISGKLKDPIHAVAPGRVIYKGSALKEYGNLVIVKHDNSLLSVYAHTHKILVSEGSTVNKGQEIAQMGLNLENKPLLHFEIRASGKPVDPLKYLVSRKN
jgi:lipoprotein NlpD